MSLIHIGLVPGDGIGPEVIDEGVKVLRAIEERLHQVQFQFTYFTINTSEYLRTGKALSQSTFEDIQKCDAILLGAVGLPSVRLPNGTEVAPQLDLREQLDLYLGVRPVYLYHSEHSPLKGYAKGQIDFVIVRENTEGLFSTRLQRHIPETNVVSDSLKVSRRASERIFRAAFREAVKRRGLVTLVDKANALPSMAFFRSIFDEVSLEFPNVRTEKLYADAATFHLIRRPHTFDVVVTENVLGDILSDLASGIAGGMGMTPSADIGDRHAMFQPAHGSAPDIAGKGIANPTGTILSAAMLLEWLGYPETIRGAGIVRRAVESFFAGSPLATPDLGGSLSTSEVGNHIIAAFEQ